MADGSSKNSSRRWWLFAAVAATFGGAVLLFWLFGFFREGAEIGSRAFVAVAALVGLLVSETIAVIGVLVRDSMDRRTADLREVELRQAEIAEERNQLLAQADANRNRTDTVLRAVQLIGDPSQEGSNHRMAGIVAALTALDEVELSLTFVDELWSAGHLGDDAAFAVLRRALADDSEMAQEQRHASAILLKHSDRIHLAGGAGRHSWPLPVWELPKYLDVPTRLQLVNAAHKWMRDELKQSEDSGIPAAAIVLYVFAKDENLVVRNWARDALTAVLPYLREAWPFLDGLGLHKAAIESVVKDAGNEPPTPIQACTDLITETVAILGKVQEAELAEDDGDDGNSDSSSPGA